MYMCNHMCVCMSYYLCIHNKECLHMLHTPQLHML